MVINTRIKDLEEAPRVPQSVMQVETVNNYSIAGIEKTDVFGEFNNQDKIIGLMIEV